MGAGVGEGGKEGGRSKRLVTCDFRLLTVTVTDTPRQAAAGAARLTARSTFHVPRDMRHEARQVRQTRQLESGKWQVAGGKC